MEINEYLEKEKEFDTEQAQNRNFDHLVKFMTVWIKDREPEKYAELLSRFKHLEPSIVANQEIASSVQTPPDDNDFGSDIPF